MIRQLKLFFIPHSGNNHAPHFLHTRRAALYSVLFLAMKVIVVSTAILMPLEAFVAPDVLAEAQRQLIILTNKARQEAGVPPLASVSILTQTAGRKAADMAAGEYFSHVSPVGQRQLKDFLVNANYKYQVAGENLAMGFPDAASVLFAWLNSPGHRANLLDPSYTEMGVGVASGKFNNLPTVYVAEHFGYPSPVVKMVAARSGVVSARAAAKPSNKVSQVSSSTALAAPVAVRGEAISYRDDAAPLYGGAHLLPLDKYTYGRQMVAPLKNMFSVSRNIYLAFLALFAITLVFMVAIKARRQYYHLIAQTLGVMALLVVCVIV